MSSPLCHQRVSNGQKSLEFIRIPKVEEIQQKEECSQILPANLDSSLHFTATSWSPSGLPEIGNDPIDPAYDAYLNIRRPVASKLFPLTPSDVRKAINDFKTILATLRMRTWLLL
ncbi:hypothetical protein TNCV_4356991 [Trichonephila clavipes]|nr:hypothetical protein TNCV_4356991 [Trichonephila clavipes]